MSSATVLSVIGANPGTRVEIVPGRKFAPINPEAVNQVALADLVPAGDGTWRVVARVCPRYFSCSGRNLRRLGIDISRRSMLRLITAGFVQGQKTTPNLFQFDYFSYLRHEEATKDPEFWERKEAGERFTNLERFRQAV